LSGAAASPLSRWTVAPVEDDALRQRPALVRALVPQRKNLVRTIAEHRDITLPGLHYP